MKEFSNIYEIRPLTGEKPAVYEFEGFVLDTGRRCLWHGGELVSLTPKAVETLIVLVESSGEVVDKQMLLDQVWADTFVEESTLSQNILTLRKTLAGFEQDKKFIATVPRRGYRFIAPVRKANRTAVREKANGNGAADHKGAENDRVIHIVSDQHAELSENAEAGPVYSFVFAIALGILVIGVGVLGWYWGAAEPLVETKFKEFRVSSLMSDAKIRSATISPDGNYLAIVDKVGDGERLLVRQVNEANPVEVVPAGTRRIVGTAFAPDGQYVFYTQYRTTPDGRLGELYRVPALGGPSQLIASDIDSSAAVSGTGEISFVRRRPSEGDTAVVVTNLEGKNERIAATRKLDEAFINAAISPDGRSIVCAANSKGDLARPMDLVIVDAAGGQQRVLTEQTWLWIGQAAWLADGSGVALVGYTAMSPDLTDEVWFVSVPDGKARMLEAGVNGALGVSVTSDANSIVAVRSEKITSFVVSPLAGVAAASVITTRAGDQSLLPLGMEWTGDDRILFSAVNGNADVWSMKPDGSGRRQLTADKYADFGAKASPDGRYLYFLSNRSGQMTVWRSNADGSEPKKITDRSDVFSVDVSPDGKSIYYTTRADSVFSQHLWRANADGGDAVKLTAKTTFSPRLSPDGKTIACYIPGSPGGAPVLTILNAETGEVVSRFAERRNDVLVEWQKDGKALLLVSRDGQGSILWKLPLDQGDAVKLHTWPNEAIFRMAVSPAGDRLFYEKGVSVNNVILLTDAAAGR